MLIFSLPLCGWFYLSYVIRQKIIIAADINRLDNLYGSFHDFFI